MNSYTFLIGFDEGKYPPSTKITDTILGKSSISSIIINNVISNKGFIHKIDKNMVDFSAFNGISDGDTVTINFQNSI